MARVPDRAPQPDADDSSSAASLDVDVDLPDDFDWDAVPDEDAAAAAAAPPAANGHAPAAPRPDGVVADPTGLDSLEAGEIEQAPPQREDARRREADDARRRVADADRRRREDEEKQRALQLKLEEEEKKKHDPAENEPYWVKLKREKKKKQKNSNNPNAQKLYCAICKKDILGRASMDSHLRGKSHMANVKQAALRDANKQISNHSRAIVSQNRSPGEPGLPIDPWDTNDVPPAAPAPLPSSPEHRQGPPRADRDPRVSQERAHRPDALVDRDSGNRDARPNRDPRIAAKESRFKDAKASRLASRDNQVAQSRDPYADDRDRNRKAVPSQSPKTTAPSSPDTPEDPKKRKRKESVGDHAEQDRMYVSQQPVPPGRSQRYAPSEDGATRRRLMEDRLDRERSALGHGRAAGPHKGANHSHRRVDDDSRRFEYDSVPRDVQDGRCRHVPNEYLSEAMTIEEWSAMRKHTFDRGSEVDQLAYKMLQEILLSPVAGVGATSLAPFSRAMVEALKRQRVTPEGDVYALFDDFPRSFIVRDEKYSDGDPEWQKTQTPEDLAVNLVSDNIVFCLHPYQDSSEVSTTEPSNFPRRGSFGARNMARQSRDDSKKPKFPILDNDALFIRLCDYLLNKNCIR